MAGSERLEARIDLGTIALDGTLTVPRGAKGLVVFAHGSGSSRYSPRNRRVADVLDDHGLATLLFDLLTSEEELIDRQTSAMRFDIDLLSERLGAAVEWVRRQPAVDGARIGLFGASTGAAAALIAAARLPRHVHAVVSRGGRPDLAGDFLGEVRAPTLLVVGGADHAVIRMNRDAAARLRAPVRIEIVEGAGHLFEEPGALDRAALLAAYWFRRHLIEAVASSGFEARPR